MMKKFGIVVGFFLCFNLLNIVVESGQLVVQMVEGVLIDYFICLWIYFVLDDVVYKFWFIYYYCIKEDQNLLQMILVVCIVDGVY